MQSSIILGVDIGGSHITSALVDIKDRKILQDTLRRVKIDSKGTAEEIVDSWSETLKGCLLHTANAEIVSIAMPGPFDYSNGVCLMRGNNKYERLYGLNIRELLLRKLYPLAKEILFTNDAACFLQGEVFCGAARGYEHVLGLTLGTGFGSAITENNIARNADFWNYPFVDSICEEYFSTRWFVKRFFELSGKTVSNVKEVVDDINHQGIREAVFEEFSHNLSSFLLKLLREKKYEAIVLGGNISKANSLFIPKVKAILQERNFDVELLVSKLGESAALIGAASYAG